MKHFLLIIFAIMILTTGCSCQLSDTVEIKSLDNQNKEFVGQDCDEEDEQSKNNEADKVANLVYELSQFNLYSGMKIYLDSNMNLCFNLDESPNKNEIIHLTYLIEGNFSEIIDNLDRPGFADGYNKLVEELDELLYQSLVQSKI